MKTIGERIKQARDALGWSGLHLANKVGYKTQSGISNLEQRATGSGGNRIHKIAQALNVPLEWVMNGPDSDTVPFIAGIENISDHENVVQLPITSDQTQQYDPLTRQVISLFSEFDTAQKSAAIALLTQFAAVIKSQKDGQAL